MAASRMPLFQERFQSLRGTTPQRDFAEMIGISRATVSLYESGARIPDIEVLKQIADACDVSADWLLGLSEARNRKADVAGAVALTGLSEEAVNTLQTMAAENRERLPYLSAVISAAGNTMAKDLKRIDDAAARAKQSAYLMEDDYPLPPEITPQIKRAALIACHDELELSLFAFERLCRDIPQIWDAPAVLDSYERAFVEMDMNKNAEDQK